MGQIPCKDRRLQATCAMWNPCKDRYFQAMCPNWRKRVEIYNYATTPNQGENEIHAMYHMHQRKLRYPQMLSRLFLWPYQLTSKFVTEDRVFVSSIFVFRAIL